MIRVLGHPAPREPLLFLLWMTVALTSTEFGAMRISNEHRSRKHSHPKPHELKPRISNTLHNDFPYRYVFPANHPLSTLAQYLTVHPTSSTNSHNYDIFATAATPQQYHTNQIPEYKYLYKPPHPYPPQPYSSPNPLPVSPIPFNPTQSPVILLLHAGQPNAGPVQTFVLIPADSSPLNLPVHGNPAYPNPLPGLQFATNTPYNIPTRSIPLTSAAAPLYTQYHKPNNHYQNQIHSQMIQRPVNLYQLQPKYYPQKKNSIESKISSDEEKPQNTTTERSSEKLNIGALRTRS